MKQESDWMLQGACRGVDPELFFPERGNNRDLAAAKAVCRQCVVVDECLNYALENNIREGTWGATSERQRRKLRAKRRREQGNADVA